MLSPRSASTAGRVRGGVRHEAPTRWVPGLDHEIIDHAMEEDAVVEDAIHEPDEVPDGVGNLLLEQLEDDGALLPITRQFGLISNVDGHHRVPVPRDVHRGPLERWAIRPCGGIDTFLSPRLLLHRRDGRGGSTQEHESEDERASYPTHGY